MVLNPSPARAVLLVLCLSACAASDPGLAQSGASADVLVGYQALSSNDDATASAAFGRALQGDPGNHDLQRQAFTAAVLSGQPGSMAQAASLAQSLPSDAAALLVLADSDIQAGQWQQAAAQFAKLPDDGPSQVLRPLLVAWAQQGAGETDAALQTLQPYLEGTRFRGLFALHAALISDLAGRAADADRLYRLALAENSGLNLRLGTLVASWQARSNHPAEARGTIRAMAQTSPDIAIAEPALQQNVAATPVPSAVDGVAESYLAVAAALQLQNSPEFAMVLLRLAVDLRPDFTSARLLLAEVLAERGALDDAVAALAPVQPDDPLAPVVQLRQARYADLQGHAAEAGAMLQRLASAYPSQAEPLAMLGEVQSARGEFPAAAATYGRAIDRLGQPNRSDWALYYQQGVAFDRAHEWPRAEADFLHALQLSPDQPFVLNYLGYAWTEQGRNLAQARQMIERAVEERPNDGSIVDSLGWVLLQDGDKAGAITVLERAVELQPEDATINAHLGDAYQAAGRLREAEVQWRRALVLKPGPQDAARLEAKLAAAAGHTPLPVTAERRVE